jgi:hypothetical protein
MEHVALQMKAAVAIHELDVAKLQAALQLSLACIAFGDVVASEHGERIDSEAIHRPVAVTGNESEPVRVFFLKCAPPIPWHHCPRFGVCGLEGSPYGGTRFLQGAKQSGLLLCSMRALVMLSGSK